MHVYRLHRTQILPVSLDAAWDFLCRPEHLRDLTSPGVRLTVTSDLPDRMYPGLLITYRLGLYSMFYFNWVTEITQAEPLSYFIDEQRSGPYRFWHHEHRLRSVEGGVEMDDLVHYALPFGVLGRMVHAAIVKNQLNAIFDYRREALADRFGTPVR
ncbi:MAG: SRPBCC family protein [Gemmatimonadetes bacterium]|nr:SRPBCC family protein [Gemmatimonadota bacterium]MYG85405.1 SRPBCC family protein [Gemmatimonadota bacterium]MYJ89072.1 SRPBCC family protein [Gemmatimonadota bacterium]